MGWIQIKNPKCTTQATLLDTTPVSVTGFWSKTSSIRSGPGNL